MTKNAATPMMPPAPPAPDPPPPPVTTGGCTIGAIAYDGLGIIAVVISDAATSKEIRFFITLSTNSNFELLVVRFADAIVTKMSCNEIQLVTSTVKLNVSRAG